MSLRPQSAPRRTHLYSVRTLLRHPFLSWRRVATCAAAALTVGMAYHVVFGQNGLTAYEYKRQESRSLDRESDALRKENEFYRGHVARLETDPSAIEHQAREELHYTRPGEVIYTLPVAPADSHVQQ